MGNCDVSDNTKIEWADATVNAINGCSLASPGCTNCYAMRLAGTRMKHHPTRAGLTKDTKVGPVWTGNVRLHEPALLQPLRWKRPRRIFWNAHGDLFHENVPDEWIDRVFAVCALTPWHTHMILTKRSARMREYLSIRGGDWMIKWPDANPPGSLPVSRHEQRLAMQGKGWPDATIRPVFPLQNVWLGVSVEDQARADERREDFRNTPAAVKFVSYEPALGPVDWAGWEFVQQIIAGGESGQNARPSHPDWFRTTRDWCAPNEIAFFFKQWGEWATVFDRDREDPDWRYCGRWEREYPKGRWHNLAGGTGFHGDRVLYVTPVGKARAGRLLDGIEHNGTPEVRS
jgi:protein gp37